MFKKIAFIGSVGSGKTTIIEQLSNIKTLNTDVESSVDIGKGLTTVGIDYGHIKVDKKTTLSLYGVPGQRKFSMVWDFVKEGLWAIVILIKNDDIDSLSEIEYLIEYFEITRNTTCVIGITHAEKGDVEFTMENINSRIHKHNLQLPIFTIDARRADSAILIMETIIAIKENN